MPSTRKTGQDRTNVRTRVKTHREGLRAAGLRPVQVWVPDTRRPGFSDEARRQCLLANASAFAQEDQAFVDALSWLGTDEAR